MGKGKKATEKGDGNAANPGPQNKPQIAKTKASVSTNANAPKPAANASAAQAMPQPSNVTKKAKAPKAVVKGSPAKAAPEVNNKANKTNKANKANKAKVSIPGTGQLGSDSLSKTQPKAGTNSASVNAKVSKGENGSLYKPTSGAMSGHGARATSEPATAGMATISQVNMPASLTQSTPANLAKPKAINLTQLAANCFLQLMQEETDEKNSGGVRTGNDQDQGSTSDDSSWVDIGEASSSGTQSISALADRKSYHLSLLCPTQGEQESEIAVAPVVTADALNIAGSTSSSPISQYGLLAGLSDVLDRANSEDSVDPRIFFNIASPSSTFICGSQGSGKSHTLSCLLENCLIRSRAAELHRPLTGLVFHYDTFISDFGGSPCEAAYLSSNKDVKVRVLCAPTNLRTMRVSLHGVSEKLLKLTKYQDTYRRLNVTVEPLQIDQQDLNTKRMSDLMAVDAENGTIPLYMHTISRILREMRMVQQALGTKFDYSLFRAQIATAGLMTGQLVPLEQRLGILETFLPSSQRNVAKSESDMKGKGKEMKGGTDWGVTPGTLTIVDLSCPCITPELACSLFNICLSIFLEGDPNVGRIVALDEAHKYMNASAEASIFTSTLLTAVRLQRHLGVRVVVSTQEPTVSPALLDLSSVTIVHRFTSPAWLNCLRAHLAAASLDTAGAIASMVDEEPEIDSNDVNSVDRLERIFQEVVGLRVGEALLFSPSGMIAEDGAEGRVRRLGSSYLKVRVRARLTEDGGKSIIVD